jgi:hypothetical protein
VTIDTAAVPDALVLIECLREGFEEILTLAGDHVPVQVPMREVLKAAAPGSEL